MLLSQKELRVSLYEEHIEEASFLYAQRVTLGEDPSISWLDVAEFEDRLEAHLDGLIIGGGLALEICERRAVEGDFGELFAAFSVLCRQGRVEAALGILEQVDGDDTEKVQAAADAFAAELSEDWIPRLTSRITGLEAPSSVVRSVVRFLGNRRAPVAMELEKVLLRGSNVRREAIWALGRTKQAAARRILAPLSEDTDRDARHAALHALLQLGDWETSKKIANSVSDSSMHDLVALGCVDVRVESLIAQVEAGSAGAPLVQAIGMYGCPTSVPSLIAWLERPALVDAAAAALDLITGGGARQEIVQGSRTNEGDVSPGGESDTTAAAKVSSDPAHWRNWWKTHSSSFNSGARYRNGKRFAPPCLLQNMETPNSPPSVRRSAYDELVIRYGLDVPFNHTDSVARQKAAIEEIRRWIGHREFVDGSWYFAGRFRA